MKTRVTLVFLFLACLSFAQNEKELKEITDKVIKIDEKAFEVNNDSISTIQESGALTKKSFLFFKKTIGGYHFNSYSKKNDTLVLKVEEFYSYKNGTNITESYYFSDNRLIKYHYLKEKNLINLDFEKLEEANVFFKNDKVIKQEVFGNTNKTNEQIIQKAHENKSTVLKND